MRTGGIGDHRLDGAAAQSRRGVDGRTLGRVLHSVVEQVVEDLVQPFRIGRDRRDVVRHVEVERQPARAGTRSHHLELLLQLSAQVDRGDVQRDRTRLHSCQVEQLLGHTQHALGLLVNDGRGPRAIGLTEHAAVHQRLAEADEARERRLQLV